MVHMVISLYMNWPFANLFDIVQWKRNIWQHNEWKLFETMNSKQIETLIPGSQPSKDSVLESLTKVGQLGAVIIAVISVF